MGLPFPRRLGLWTAIAAVSVVPLSAAADSASVRFKLPPNASDLVLERRATGGYGREDRSLKLFGDGRFVQVNWKAKPEPTTVELAQLGIEEMEALVRIAIEGGLFDAAQEDLRGTADVVSSDPAWSTLTIHLADYAGKGPTRLKLETPGALWLARYNKDNPSIVALGALEERLLMIQVKHRAR